MKRGNTFYFKVLFGYLVFALLPGAVALGAQPKDDFEPCKTYSAKSKELIQSLETLLTLEAASIGKKDNALVNSINHQRMKYMTRLVKNHAFIQDDSLEGYVRAVVNKIVEANGLYDNPARQVLIAQSPFVNAFCYGKGIFVVNIGLLGRISNENHLAFVMAHEIAHDELNHIREKVLMEAEVNLAKRSKEQIQKILTGKIAVEDIEEYRNLTYGVSRYSRANEMEADSLALILLSRTGYARREAIGVLDILQNSLKPKHDIGPDFFLPFHSHEYPFQEYWLNERLSLYSQKHNGNYMFYADSLESHPDIGKRRYALNNARIDHWRNGTLQPIGYTTDIIAKAEMQTVESALQIKEYDQCLFYAMQMLARHPKNAYLVSRIGKVFVDLIEARDNNIFNFLVNTHTHFYSEELRLMNNFLHNLERKEMAEVGYHFLNNRFNPERRSHYFLLWKMSGLTYRNDVRRNMERAYKEKFHQDISLFKFR